MWFRICQAAAGREWTAHDSLLHGKLCGSGGVEETGLWCSLWYLEPRCATLHHVGWVSTPRWWWWWWWGVVGLLLLLLLLLFLFFFSSFFFYFIYLFIYFFKLPFPASKSSFVCVWNRVHPKFFLQYSLLPTYIWSYYSYFSFFIIFYIYIVWFLT